MCVCVLTTEEEASLAIQKLLIKQN